MKKNFNKKAICFIGTIAICLSNIMVVFAATDPVDQVNNLASHIGKLITAVGAIALLVGVVIFVQGLVGHDPSQKMMGGLVMAGGILLASASYVVSNWLTSAYITVIPDVTSAFNSITSIGLF